MLKLLIISFMTNPCIVAKFRTIRTRIVIKYKIIETNTIKKSHLVNHMHHLHLDCSNVKNYGSQEMKNIIALNVAQ